MQVAIGDLSQVLVLWVSVDKDKRDLQFNAGYGIADYALNHHEGKRR